MLRPWVHASRAAQHAHPRLRISPRSFLATAIGRRCALCREGLRAGRCPTAHPKTCREPTAITWARCLHLRLAAQRPFAAARRSHLRAVGPRAARASRQDPPVRINCGRACYSASQGGCQLVGAGALSPPARAGEISTGVAAVRRMRTAFECHPIPRRAVTCCGREQLLDTDARPVNQ